MDMRWWWLRDKERNKEIIIYWQPGGKNMGDYYTKHHTGTHHRDVRPQYVCNNLTQKLNQNKNIHQNEADNKNFLKRRCGTAWYGPGRGLPQCRKTVMQ